MNRAELRRIQKKENKEIAKANKILKKAGFPSFQMPPAPLKTTNLSMQEVSNFTGAKIAVLEQWRREQIKEIEKSCMEDAQERLAFAEEYTLLHNIIASLKALEGFRYAKAAANYLIQNYKSDFIEGNEDIRSIYEDLHERWGIQLVFDTPDINEVMKFEEYDWRKTYTEKNIPVAVFDAIQDDAANIQSVYTQLAVLLVLCKEFGFAKHKNSKNSMLEKFMRCTKEKYEEIADSEHGAREALKELREKYEIDIEWSKETQKTIDKYDI